MTVITPAGYAPPAGDQPLSHARIAHANNWFTRGAVTVTNTEPGFFADGPLNTLTYEKWAPSALPAVWEYYHVRDSWADYCCIGAHTLGSEGCVIQVQVFGVNNWVTIIDETAITTDDPIVALFPRTDGRNFRIRIASGGNPRIGVIKFGRSLQLPVATYAGHIPDQFALETEMRTNQSESGEFLGRSVERRRTVPGYQWEHIPYPWLSANMRSLQNAFENEPFFVAWRPNAYNSTAFGYVNSIPQPQAMGIRDLYTLGFNMVGHRGAPT